MKIRVHYAGRKPGFGNECTVEAEWKQGDDALKINAENIIRITASGKALNWIRLNITGIPMLVSAGEFWVNHSFEDPVNWYGDHAKFIASLIPGLLA
jgi:hypothetical protein